MSSKSEKDKQQYKEYRKLFPEILPYVTSTFNTSRQFSEEIIRAAKLLRLDKINSADRDIFKLLKKIGFDALSSKANGFSSNDKNILHASLWLTPGSLLYEMIDKLDKTFLQRYTPYSFAMVRPDYHQLTIVFSEMNSIKTENGHAYLYQDNPINCFENGGRKRIAFSKHALERMRDRLNPRESWRTYGASADLFSFYTGGGVANLVDANSSTKYQQPLIALYILAPPGRFHYSNNAENILPEFDSQKYYYYTLAGYCPYVKEGNTLVAVTFLSPGMTETPEFHLLQKFQEPEREVHKKYLENDLFDYNHPKNYGLLKYLHENGAPHIVRKPMLMERTEGPLLLSKNY